MDFLKKLEVSKTKGSITPKVHSLLTQFYVSYREAVTENGHGIDEYLPLLEKLLELIELELAIPSTFSPYHQALRTPFDYYQFGLDLLRPLVIFEQSTLIGADQLDLIEEKLKKQENVILLANHQTEPDPQAISLLLEASHRTLAEGMIFVAGHRVTTDPLAVPLSLGRNLLCIFSKKHMDQPSEEKEAKLQHNQRTMKQLLALLQEGGKCVYVAPSGGRDRQNEQGEIEIAPFDPQSLELFWLIAKQAGRPTHFHPLALSTYALLPPPSLVEKELGERRHAHCTPIHLAFGSEVEMQFFQEDEALDKKEKRQARADKIWLTVKDLYDRIAS